MGHGFGFGTWRRRGGGNASFIGPLDAVAGQLYAVIGPHRALSSYAGPCYRVRRSVDAAEVDIGFDPDGWVSTSALVSAAAGGTLTVVRDYDKTGQGHDGVQTTVANQWTIVSAGVVNVGPNGHPCPVLDGNGDHVRLANSAGYSRNQAALTMAAIARRTGPNALNETQAFVQCATDTTRLGFALWISTYALSIWGYHPDGAPISQYNGAPSTLNAWQRFIGRARAADGLADTMVSANLTTGSWGGPGAFSDTDQSRGDVYVGTTYGGGHFKGDLGLVVLMQGNRDVTPLDAGLSLMMP